MTDISFAKGVTALSTEMFYACGSVTNVSFRSWVSVPASAFNFSTSHNCDYRVRMYVPANDPNWQAWLENPANMVPWASCSKNEYTSRYGANAPHPLGLTTRAAISTQMWVFREGDGMKLIFR